MFVVDTHAINVRGGMRIDLGCTSPCGVSDEPTSNLN
jgi:hypothetical protein